MPETYESLEEGGQSFGRGPAGRRAGLAMLWAVLVLGTVLALCVFTGGTEPKQPPDKGEAAAVRTQYPASAPKRNNIPTVLLSAGDRAVLLSARGRDWRTEGGWEHMEAAAAVEDRDLAVFLVQPGTTVHLTFFRAPSQVTVRAWRTSDKSELTEIGCTAIDEREYTFTVVTGEETDLVVEISAVFPLEDGAGGAVSYAVALFGEDAPGEPRPEVETPRLGSV